MEPVESERVHGGGAEAAKPGPGVVERGGAVGEPEPRQVERDSAQATRGQLTQDLAVQEARGRHPVQAHDRLAAGRWAGFPHETGNTGSLKTPPGSAVLLHHVMAVHPRTAHSLRPWRSRADWRVSGAARRAQLGASGRSWTLRGIGIVIAFSS